MVLWSTICIHFKITITQCFGNECAFQHRRPIWHTRNVITALISNIRWQLLLGEAARKTWALYYALYSCCTANMISESINWDNNMLFNWKYNDSSYQNRHMRASILIIYISVVWSFRLLDRMMLCCWLWFPIKMSSRLSDHTSRWEMSS